MSSERAIRVSHLSKRYEIYKQPSDRLRQMVMAGACRAFGLSKRDYFREFWALRDVSFEVDRGESLAIIGQNGSGKSTLLQLICGTLHPTEGSVGVTGRIAALLELGAGFNPEFSGRENVYLSGLLYGLEREALAERFESIVQFSGIGEFIDRPVKTYSSGMYVRLAFAIAAHVDADALIIDEALSVGDVRFTQKCMRFLREFQSRGTLLFVSHDTAAVTGLCDRALWLHEGRLRMDSTAKTAVETYLAEQHALTRNELGAQVRVGGREMPLASSKSQPATLSQAVVSDPADVRSQMSDAKPFGSVAQVFAFDPGVADQSFGERGASIERIELCDERDDPVSVIDSGVLCSVLVVVVAHRPLERIIIGFYFKDRLGQRLFGDNTYLTYRDSPCIAAEGDRVEARFRFRLPLLPKGDYSIDAAVATGTQEDHTQQHWVHDGMTIRVIESSALHCLVGIPMHDIRLRRVAPS